jgi:hypothetical protein
MARTLKSGIVVSIITKMTPIQDSLIVVTGLPRSGTSMLMQMLSAGGIEVVSDGLRKADEDNPHGYLEFEPVKKLLRDSSWLSASRGKAIKIVAPLLSALPPALPCRVIVCERDLDEVLDSQERMLVHRGSALATTPERRRMLKQEYARTLSRVDAMLARRPDTLALVVNYGNAITDSFGTAGKVSQFLGVGLDVEKMASAVTPSLYRNIGLITS